MGWKNYSLKEDSKAICDALAPLQHIGSANFNNFLESQYQKFFGYRFSWFSPPHAPISWLRHFDNNRKLTKIFGTKVDHRCFFWSVSVFSLYCSLQSSLYVSVLAVFRIRDILFRIRIRFGSVPLTNGSGSGSCSIRQWPSRHQQKIFFFKHFFYY